MKYLLVLLLLLPNPAFAKVKKRRIAKALSITLKISAGILILTGLPLIGLPLAISGNSIDGFLFIRDKSQSDSAEQKQNSSMESHTSELTRDVSIK